MIKNISFNKFDNSDAKSTSLFDVDKKSIGRDFTKILSEQGLGQQTNAENKQRARVDLAIESSNSTQEQVVQDKQFTPSENSPKDEILLEKSLTYGEPTAKVSTEISRVIADWNSTTDTQNTITLKPLTDERFGEILDVKPIEQIDVEEVKVEKFVPTEVAKSEAETAPTIDGSVEKPMSDLHGGFPLETEQRGQQRFPKIPIQVFPTEIEPRGQSRFPVVKTQETKIDLEPRGQQMFPKVKTPGTKIELEPRGQSMFPAFSTNQKLDANFEDSNNFGNESENSDVRFVINQDNFLELPPSEIAPSEIDSSITNSILNLSKSDGEVIEIVEVSNPFESTPKVEFGISQDVDIFGANSNVSKQVDIESGNPANKIHLKEGMIEADLFESEPTPTNTVQDSKVNPEIFHTFIEIPTTETQITSEISGTKQLTIDLSENNMNFSVDKEIAATFDQTKHGHKFEFAEIPQKVQDESGDNLPAKPASFIETIQSNEAEGYEFSAERNDSQNYGKTIFETPEASGIISDNSTENTELNISENQIKKTVSAVPEILPTNNFENQADATIGAGYSDIVTKNLEGEDRVQQTQIPENAVEAKSGLPGITVVNRTNNEFTSGAVTKTVDANRPEISALDKELVPAKASPVPIPLGLDQFVTAESDDSNFQNGKQIAGSVSNEVVDFKNSLLNFLDKTLSQEKVGNTGPATPELTIRESTEKAKGFVNLAAEISDGQFFESIVKTSDTGKPAFENILPAFEVDDQNNRTEAEAPADSLPALDKVEKVDTANESSDRIEKPQVLTPISSVEQLKVVVDESGKLSLPLFAADEKLATESDEISQKSSEILGAARSFDQKADVLFPTMDVSRDISEKSKLPTTETDQATVPTAPALNPPNSLIRLYTRIARIFREDRSEASISRASSAANSALVQTDEIQKNQLIIGEMVTETHEGDFKTESNRSKTPGELYQPDPVEEKQLKFEKPLHQPQFVGQYNAASTDSGLSATPNLSSPVRTVSSDLNPFRIERPLAKLGRTSIANNELAGSNFQRFLSPLSNVRETESVSSNTNVIESTVFDQIEPRIIELASVLKPNEEKQLLKMRLNPAELGEVEIRIERDSSGNISAQFKTASETTRNVLIDSLGQLRESMQNSGLKVENLEVSLSSSSTNGNESRDEQSRRPEQVKANGSFAGGGDTFVENEGNSQDELANRLVNLRA